MPSESEHNRKTTVRALLVSSQIVLVALAWPAAVRGQCAATIYGGADDPVRVDSNHVMTEGQTWTSDEYGYWTPYVEAWQEFMAPGASSGGPITDGEVADADPGDTAWVELTTILNAQGPGTYWDYGFHWAVANQDYCPGWYDEGFYYDGPGLTISRPTIAGIPAFWWLGSGVLSDHGYYAQSALTANPNGASGTPSWSVQMLETGGVTLQCNVCTDNVATSTSFSCGCYPDVTIWATYGGFESEPFNVTIVKPSTLTLDAGYPQDSNDQDGYLSLYQWSLTDSCGYQDAGLDGNEVFGAWTDDYFNSTGTHNNWGLPTAAQAYSPTNLWTDKIWVEPCANGKPKCTNPQKPTLSTVAVRHNTPWTFYIGTQTFGSGVPVESDTQQNYLDHGRHQ
jgi:hypothetical protein